VSVVQVEKIDSKRLDTYAIGISGLCLLHCVLTSFIIPFFPMFASQFVQDEAVHVLLFVLALPLSVIALYFGKSKHQRSRYLMVGLVGLGFMFAGLFEIGGHIGETILTTIGVLTLASAHLGNYSANKKDKTAHA
jgi:hypothetical protein